MKHFNISRAIAGGIAGTLLMTIMTMLAPMMGMPKMDIAAMLGSMLGGPPPEVGSSAWLVGFGMHLMIGIAVLAIGYALVNDYLPTSSSLAKGLLYGGIVWLMAQLIVMPMMGAGFFSSHLPQGMTMAGASLMGHLIYGAALGLAYGHQPADRRIGDVSTLGL
jgi:uncharacterized protein DUF6789